MNFTAQTNTTMKVPEFSSWINTEPSLWKSSGIVFFFFTPRAFTETGCEKKKQVSVCWVLSRIFVVSHWSRGTFFTRVLIDSFSSESRELLLLLLHTWPTSVSTRNNAACPHKPIWPHKSMPLIYVWSVSQAVSASGVCQVPVARCDNWADVTDWSAAYRCLLCLQ